MLLNNPELILATAKQRQMDLEREAEIERMLCQASAKPSGRLMIQAKCSALIQMLRSILQWFREGAHPPVKLSSEGR